MAILSSETIKGIRDVANAYAAKERERLGMSDPVKASRLAVPTGVGREEVAWNDAISAAALAVEGLRREVPYEYNPRPCTTTMKRAAAAVRALIKKPVGLPTTSCNAVTAEKERVARAVYEAMKWAADQSCTDCHPAWVEGGNSFAQDEARRSADRILSHAEAGGVEVPSGWSQGREQGQAEGFAAAVQWLRDRSAMKPRALLWAAAETLADQMEQSRVAASPAAAAGGEA